LDRRLGGPKGKVRCKWENEVSNFQTAFQQKYKSRERTVKEVRAVVVYSGRDIVVVVVEEEGGGRDVVK
jgi:hypothetical protein